MLGHRVGDGQPLEDIIDVKEESLTSIHTEAESETCEETIPLNELPMELEREPPDISGAIKHFENGEKITPAIQGHRVEGSKNL